MGQVGSLLLGNEMPEAPDWLLRSEGAARMLREGGRVEEHPGGPPSSGRGEGSRREDRVKKKKGNTERPRGLGHPVYLLWCPQ